MTGREQVAGMLTAGGNTVVFMAAKTLQQQAKDGLDETFDIAIVEDMSVAFIQWIGTRIIRYEGSHGLMPQSMRVTITVDLQA